MTLEDSTYIYNFDGAKQKIYDVCNMLSDYNIAVEGIHIDVEPHALDGWTELSYSEQDEFLDLFLQLELLELVRQSVDEYSTNYLLSAAVAYWLPMRVQKGLYTHGRGYYLVSDKRLHMVAPMIYEGAGGSVDRVVERAVYYLNDGVSTVVGMGVDDYNYND